MKRLIKSRSSFCIIMCMLLTLLFAYPVYAGDFEEGQAVYFRDDGSFRILLIADTQDTDKPQELMLELLNAELDAADADLVIFLGDNIYGPHIGEDRKKVEAAINAVVAPVAERKIPFVAAFGNHDDQGCLSKEEQLEIYRSYPGCLNEDPDIPGVGNTCLPLYDRNAETPSVLLWIMDSGTYAEEEIGGYGYVTEEQNQWFREGTAAFDAENMPVSYVFQHIPVPQAYDLLEPARAFSENAFCTFWNPFSEWYREKEGAVREGRFGEPPCPPKIDSGEFQSWKDCGVKAAFFGHDHVNDYVGTVEGIDLVSTCGIGFYAYGRGDEHGARILVLHADDPDQYETKMVYYRDLFDKPIGLLQGPHFGVQVARIVNPVVVGLIVLIAVLVVRSRSRRKKRGRKNA